MTVVAKSLGRKALAIYLGAIMVSSISLGIVLNKIYFYFYDERTFDLFLHNRILISQEIRFFTSIILFLLILYNFLKAHARIKQI